MFEFLNWRTDSMLVDPEPLTQNTWLTANDLLEFNRSDSFIDSTGQLLLFPIMIRKSDFVTGERILQSFPYILLDQEWIVKIRKQSLALAEKTHSYFMNSNYIRSIRDWQKKIINYLETQQRLPFPLFRLVPSWENFFLRKQYIAFQSARGEDFQLPLSLSENLAYLTGVVMGDGHLAKYFINIIDSSKEHVNNLTKILSEMFNSKTEFFAQTNAKAWNVNILGKWIVRFVNFLSGQPIAARKYPALREPLIFQRNDTFRRLFWSGIMDADGSYKSTMGFGTASQQLRRDFAAFLDKQQIIYYFYEQEVFGGTTYSLNVAGESRKQFAQLIVSNHPQKQQELQTLLKRKVRRFSQQPHTLLQRGIWKGQIQGFNENTIQNGYFDFSLIPTLHINNFGSYIKSLRKEHNHKQRELSRYLAITSSMLSRYELGKTTLPIHLLLKVLSYYHISHRDFYSQTRKISFRSSSSNCQFPTQPEETLLTLLQGLQLKNKNYFLVIGLADKSIEQYKEEISDYFAINKQTNRIFQNSCLISLIRVYCLVRN